MCTTFYKFFHLFPHLARNKLILSGQSYGGVYVSHVIVHEQNILLQRGHGRPGSIPINIEATTPIQSTSLYRRIRCKLRLARRLFVSEITGESFPERVHLGV